jgi:NADH-quinone oxidoreductase subunit N
MTTADLRVLSPGLGVAAAAVAVLVADLLFPAHRRRLVGPLAAVLLLAILALTFAIDSSGLAAFGTYSGDAATLFFQRLFLSAGVVGILGGLAHVERRTRSRQGEYYFLLLCSLLGMMLLPGVRDLILLLIAFELMGMPLYILAAFEKARGRDDDRGRRASEAGLKLFLVGSASTALTLFGFSIVAGLAGATSFSALVAALHSPLFAAGMLLILAGIGFKLGVAPFHMWVPDAYEGAPGPFVAYLAGAPKVAAIAALCSVFLPGFYGLRAQWSPAVAALALLTMAVGSLLALPQKNVRRILAYSGVAHVGYMLLALATGTVAGVTMLLFYGAIYVATTAGVFLVAHAVASESGDDSSEGLRGLNNRSPWLALSLLVFLLSLAGIPFVAGFWAKIYVFVAAWNAGFHGLVAAGVLLSILALFFYLQLARVAYFQQPLHSEPVRVAPGLGAAILACLVAVIGIGLWPAPLLNAAAGAVGGLSDRSATMAARGMAAPGTSMVGNGIAGRFDPLALVTLKGAPPNGHPNQ